MLPTTPRLSENAYQILKLSVDGYRDLVVRGPGNAEARSRLSATDASQLISGPINDPQMAQAVACALWLWHDALDEAHVIAQGLPTDTGAFWHAIVHRRQGDFANSGHWLAQCREHPARQAIGNQAAVLLGELPSDNRLLRLTLNGWNAEYFVELVQQQHGHADPDIAPILVVLQLLEWRVLTEYCASLA